MKKLNYENTPQLFDDIEYEEFLEEEQKENKTSEESSEHQKVDWSQKVSQLFQKNSKYMAMNQTQKPKKLQKFDSKQYINLKKPKSYWKKYNQQQKLIQQNIEQEKVQSKSMKIEQELQKKGHFAFGDKIFKIVSCRATANQQISLKIQWRKRRNGKQPETSFLYNTDVKKYDPESLANYYEQLMINASKRNGGSLSKKINSKVKQKESDKTDQSNESFQASKKEELDKSKAKQIPQKAEVDKYIKRIATLQSKTMILQILVNQGGRTQPVTVQEIQYQIILHAKSQRQKQLQTANNILICLEALDQEGAIKFVDIKQNILKNSVIVII